MPYGPRLRVASLVIITIAERNLQAHQCSGVPVTPGNVLEGPRETSHIITSTPAKFQLDPLTSAWYKLCICMFNIIP